MSETLDQIQKIISKAGVDGTLTKDAVNYFGRVLEDNTQLKADVKMKDTQLVTRNSELDELNKTLVKSLEKNKT